MDKTDFENYEKLAYKIAQPYIQGFRKMSDDIKSSALLGLCEGLNQAAQKNHPNPGALIVFNVKFEIVRCLENSYCLVKIPRSYIMKKKLEAYECGEVFSIAKLYPEIIPIQEQKIDEAIFYSERKWIRIREMIAEIKLEPLEEEILIARISGYTFKEIAEDLKCSDVWAIKVMKKVREKWLKRLKRQYSSI